MYFGVLYRDMEFTDEIEGVVTAQARQVEELRKHQRHQHGERYRNSFGGEPGWITAFLARAECAERLALLVPCADVGAEG